MNFIENYKSTLVFNPSSKPNERTVQKYWRKLREILTDSNAKERKNEGFRTSSVFTTIYYYGAQEYERTLELATDILFKNLKNLFSKVF